MIDFIIIILTIYIILNFNSFFLLHIIFINVISAVLSITFLVINSRLTSTFKNFLYKD